MTSQGNAGSPELSKKAVEYSESGKRLAEARPRKKALDSYAARAMYLLWGKLHLLKPTWSLQAIVIHGGLQTFRRALAKIVQVF